MHLTRFLFLLASLLPVLASGQDSECNNIWIRSYTGDVLASCNYLFAPMGKYGLSCKNELTDQVNHYPPNFQDLDFRVYSVALDLNNQILAAGTGLFRFDGQTAELLAPHPNSGTFTKIIVMPNGEVILHDDRKDVYRWIDDNMVFDLDGIEDIIAYGDSLIIIDNSFADNQDLLIAEGDRLSKFYLGRFQEFYSPAVTPDGKVWFLSREQDEVILSVGNSGLEEISFGSIYVNDLKFLKTGEAILSSNSVAYSWDLISSPEVIHRASLGSNLSNSSDRLFFSGSTVSELFVDQQSKLVLDNKYLFSPENRRYAIGKNLVWKEINRAIDNNFPDTAFIVFNQDGEIEESVVLPDSETPIWSVIDVAAVSRDRFLVTARSANDSVHLLHYQGTDFQKSIFISDPLPAIDSSGTTWVPESEELKAILWDGTTTSFAKEFTGTIAARDNWVWTQTRVNQIDSQYFNLYNGENWKRFHVTELDDFPDDRIVDRTGNLWLLLNRSRVMKIDTNGIRKYYSRPFSWSQADLFVDLDNRVWLFPFIGEDLSVFDGSKFIFAEETYCGTSIPIEETENDNQWFVDVSPDDQYPYKETRKIGFISPDGSQLVQEIPAPFSISLECARTSSRADLTLFNIFPNPNNGSFTVDIDPAEQSDFILKVFNNLGQLVMQQSLSGLPDKIQIDLTGVSAGQYFLVLQGADTQHSRSFVVR